MMAAPKRHVPAAAALALSYVLFAAGSAQAHPHVWVTVRDTVLYNNGAVTGVQHEWTFDEIYTAMAIEGLDKNGDGIYDRQELSELAQVNIDGLKEFDYFTFAKLGEKKLSFAAPKDFWLDYTNNILTLHFTLPLAQPVPAGTPGLTFAVYDPTIFIDFEFANENAINVGGTVPAGCRAGFQPVKPDPDQDKLVQAFRGQFSTSPIGTATSNTIMVTCAK